jgi:hypothetical protein
VFFVSAVCGAPLAAACAAGSPGAASPLDETTRYDVVFHSPWSAATHPVDYPSDSHFSRLVGGTHGPGVSFWRDGERASQGIKDMAERGRTSPLDQEIAAAVAAGLAERVFTGPAVDQTPGSATMSFEISRRFPLVTLVTMVAPSPDWFVGVAGLSLLEDGNWVSERRIDLVPWDAGTDSGPTFRSPDEVTSPPGLVSRILAAPLAPGGLVVPLGSFTFTRVVN